MFIFDGIQITNHNQWNGLSGTSDHHKIRVHKRLHKGVYVKDGANKLARSGVDLNIDFVEPSLIKQLFQPLKLSPVGKTIKGRVGQNCDTFLEGLTNCAVVSL